jgi:hypothetical protein
LNGILVKLEAAKSQIEKEEAEKPVQDDQNNGRNGGFLFPEGNDNGQTTGKSGVPVEKKRNTHFTPE